MNAPHLVLYALTALFGSAVAQPQDYYLIFEGDQGTNWSIHPDVELKKMEDVGRKKPIPLVIADIWMSSAEGSHGSRIGFKCDSIGVQYKIWTRSDGTFYRNESPVTSIRGTAGHSAWSAACELYRRKLAN
jgi:hypothetical protein